MIIIKQYPEDGVMKLCSIMQDLYDSAREEGRAEGRKQAIHEMVINMIKYELPFELIAKVADMSVEKVIAIGKANDVL